MAKAFQTDHKQGVTRIDHNTMLRSILLTITQLAPVLMFASQVLPEDSFAVPTTGCIFATITAVLIAVSTTHTRLHFIRKLVASAALAAGFFLTLFVVFWTLGEEKRFVESEEWAPMGIDVWTGPSRMISAMLCMLAAIGLFWLMAAIEVPEPS